ncbi:hypothetical protein BMETH_168_0 [methanotrophic bacterial endosymbiont of Bathymodiolus sp.]|nr:hypothetical protein BMETH_168_0 [methanotrophic bacterial endosymbiont of Bathymodiolus sp.]
MTRCRTLDLALAGIAFRKSKGLGEIVDNPKNGNFPGDVYLGVEIDFRIGRKDLGVGNIRIPFSFVFYRRLQAKVVAKQVESRYDPDGGLRHPDQLISIVIIFLGQRTAGNRLCYKSLVFSMLQGRRRRNIKPFYRIDDALQFEAVGICIGECIYLGESVQGADRIAKADVVIPCVEPGSIKREHPAGVFESQFTELHGLGYRCRVDIGIVSTESGNSRRRSIPAEQTHIARQLIVCTQGPGRVVEMMVIALPYSISGCYQGGSISAQVYGFRLLYDPVGCRIFPTHTAIDTEGRCELPFVADIKRVGGLFAIGIRPLISILGYSIVRKGLYDLSTAVQGDDVQQS